MWRNRSNRKSFVENRTVRMGGWLLVLAIFGAGAVLSSPVFAADKQLTFMSGGAKGSWYRYLTAMSECMRKNSDINVTVVPTSGGMEAFRKLQEGKADVGFTFQTVAFPALGREGKLEGKEAQGIARGRFRNFLFDISLRCFEKLRHKRNWPI